MIKKKKKISPITLFRLIISWDTNNQTLESETLIISWDINNQTFVISILESETQGLNSKLLCVVFSNFYIFFLLQIDVNSFSHLIF